MIRAQKHVLQECQIKARDRAEEPTLIQAALASEATAARVQQWTFIVSLLVQVGVVIFSWISIASSDVPELLFYAMLLEAIVQTVEFAAYLIMGAMAWLTKMSVGVEWRYLDWAVTTPTMLISLWMLVQYFWKPCEADDFARDRFIDTLPYALPIILICNWAMLAFGFVVEYDTSRAVKHLGRHIVATSCHGTERAAQPAFYPDPILTNVGWFPVLGYAYLNPMSWFLVFPNKTSFGQPTTAQYRRGKSLANQTVGFRRWYLGIGFVPLLGAFILHLRASLSTDLRPSTEGAVLTIVTLVVWALYGGVALWLTPEDGFITKSNDEQAPAYVRATSTLMWKNAWYNILDLVSKNSTGILVSIVALNYDSSKCSS